jgi:hypothetical protein
MLECSNVPLSMLACSGPGSDAQNWKTLIIFSSIVLVFCLFVQSTENDFMVHSKAHSTSKTSRYRTNHLFLIGSEIFSKIHRFGLRNELCIISASFLHSFLLRSSPRGCICVLLTSPTLLVFSWLAVYGEWFVVTVFTTNRNGPFVTLLPFPFLRI